MSLSLGDITVTTACDWVAADVLFRAELQSINAEIDQIVIDMKKAEAIGDTTRVSDLQTDLESIQSIRESVIENLNTYLDERRTNLSTSE